MFMKAVSFLLLISLFLAGVVAWDMQDVLNGPFSFGELGLMVFGSVLTMSLSLFLVARRLSNVSDN